MNLSILAIIFLNMKIKRMIRGFTLIELLVVITIIGILATGAVSVYTSQIQKSRDSVRLTDVKAVQWGIEQFYQDKWEYPDALDFSWVTAYVPKLPQDPKSANASANSVFDYLYNVSPDWNTIPAQEYEVSTTFEQQGNIDFKAKTDWWDDNNRLEVWINVSDLTQSTLWATWNKWILSSINKYQCINKAASAVWVCATKSVAWDPMLIRN